MTFANPIALLWGLLAVPVVLLYMRRLRLRRRPVAADMIWQQVLAEAGTRTAWQRYRRWVSLAVQLTGLLLLVVALAEPQFTPPRRLAIIVDNSAEMNIGEGEKTRLDEAKAAAKRLIAEMRPCDMATIIATSAASGVRCSLTDEPAAVAEAIDKIEPAEGTADVERAAALAKKLLADESNGRIVLLSCNEAPKGVELYRVGETAANTAITRLNVRREKADPRRCQALVEITSFAESVEFIGVVVSLNDKRVRCVQWPTRAGRSSRQVFDLGPVESGQVTVEIGTPDAWAGDDAATVDVPPLDETDVAPNTNELATIADDFRVSDTGQAAASIIAAAPGVPPWIYLAALGLALLTAEWCLYQRRWIS